MSHRSLSVTTRVPGTTLFLVLALALCLASRAATAPGSRAPFADEPPRPFETAPPALLMPEDGIAGITRLPAIGEPALPDIRLTEFLRVPADAPTPLTPIVPAPVPEPVAADVPAAAPVEFFTLDELKEEMKKMAWVKGDYKIVPYGHLSGDMIYQTRKMTLVPAMFFVTSSTAGDGAVCSIDARRSRLGADLTGPTVCLLGHTMQTGGKVEFDFLSSVAPTENRGDVLLRHIYGELKNDDWRLLAGQTWDVISPLMPGLLSYTVGWNAGNIGFRRAQFRAERYLNTSDDLLFTVQGSLNQEVSESTASVFTVREPAAWPVLEGRCAATLGARGEGCQPITIGASGHVGETQFHVVNEQSFPTWSFNVDVRVPVTSRLGFQGEFFTGTNLITHMGGVSQGIDPAFMAPIRSTGGWGEVWYDLTPRLHAHTAFGIDDPVDGDVSANGRTYNRFIAANLVFDITKKFITGIEVTSWRTLYQAPSAPGDSVTIEWLVQYGF